MPPVMPDGPLFFPVFPVTIGVYDQEDEDDQPADNHQNDGRIALPHAADKL